MQSLGVAIKEMRKSRELSQAEVARRAGIQSGQISRIEADKRPETTFETVAIVVRAMGASLDDLAGRMGIGAVSLATPTAGSNDSKSDAVNWPHDDEAALFEQLNDPVNLPSLVAALDDRDVSPPGSLEEQLAALRQVARDHHESIRRLLRLQLATDTALRAGLGHLAELASRVPGGESLAEATRTLRLSLEAS